MFAGCYMASLTLASVGLIADPPAAWSDTARLTGTHSVIFALRRYPILQLPQFLSGIALGWIYLQSKVSRRFAQVALWSSLVVLLATLALSWHIPFILLHDGLLLPLFALLVIGLSQPNIVSRVLSVAPMLLLGEASYSFYLIHFNFKEAIWTAWQPRTDVLGLLPRLLFLVPLCVCLHLWVERPARRMLLQWWASRRQRALVAA